MSFLKKTIRKMPGGKKMGGALGAQKAGPMMGMPETQMMAAPMAAGGKASKPNSSQKTFQQPAAPQPRTWAAPTSDVPYDPNP